MFSWAVEMLLMKVERRIFPQGGGWLNTTATWYDVSNRRYQYCVIGNNTIIQGWHYYYDWF